MLLNSVSSQKSSKSKDLINTQDDLQLLSHASTANWNSILRKWILNV